MKNFNSFINSCNTICPYCLNNYLDKVKSGYINESVESPKIDVRSMSILVPTHGCVNACKFCVSKISQRKAEYDDLSKEEMFEEMYFKQFEKVSKMGCTYAILTGTGEPIQNKPFLRMIGEMNARLENPFKLELQTSGVMLTEENLRFLKEEVGVYLISLSVSNIFDDASNADIITIKPRLRFNLKSLCRNIKNMGFILRISLNLVNIYNDYTPEETVDRIFELGADQATFRVLWVGHDDNAISRWIKNNSVAQNYIDGVKQYCQNNGKVIPAAYLKYQIKDLIVVIDSDCMNEHSPNEIRYLILRSDCKLYTKWDTASSLFK